MSEVQPVLIEQQLLPQESGFRFERFEVLNWGPFDQQVWKLDFNRSNLLLIGSNGSGKSSLVDALSTLFETPGNIVYNRAAGAVKRERTLASYLRGHFRDTSEGSSEKTELRDEHVFSVIVGVFYCAKLQRRVSLGQFFYFPKEHDDTVATVYIGGTQDLSISCDLMNFGKRSADLKKKLRQSGFTIFERFSDYKQWYMRELNLSTQAVALLRQCVSLKNVSDITAFVRDYMLPPGRGAAMMRDLIDHFDDLTSCYQQVLTARDQIELLSPIEEQGQLHQAKVQEAAKLEACYKQVTPFINARQQILVQRETERLRERNLRLEAAVAADAQRRNALFEEHNRLLVRQAQAGGNALAQLKQEIAHKQELQEMRVQSFNAYAALCGKLRIEPASSAELFLRQRRELSARQEACQQAVADARQEFLEQFSAEQNMKQEAECIKQELSSLSRRDSNLPEAQIELRRRLAATLGVSPDRLPYVGELIQVKEQEKKLWEGAAERVLHSFALSLLVPDDLYSDVVHYVNSSNLRSRLIFYKHSDLQGGRSSALVSNSLAQKLEIKPDTVFYAALSQQLLQRFNLACCSDEDDFRRQAEAVMPSGLIKQRRRHEKDDRFDVKDRSRYVLGWSNTEKKQILKEKWQELQQQSTRLQEARDAAQEEMGRRMQIERAASDLLERCRDFEQLNVSGMAAEIEKLQAELNRIENENLDLKDLSAQLQRCALELQTAEKQERADLQEQSVCVEELKKMENRLAELADLQVAVPLTPEAEQILKPLYAKGNYRLTLLNAGTVIVSFMQQVKDLQSRVQQECTALSNEMCRQMGQFIDKYPALGKELSAKAEALPEFNQLLTALRRDNLPKYEDQFKQKLEHSAISDVAHLSASLEQECVSMRQRIKDINAALIGIDYYPESYIKLTLKTTGDQEILQFKDDLKKCISDSFGPALNLAAAEAKFKLLQQLIDRFKGRAESLRADEIWAQKVLDVRQWYTYAAVEYDRMTGKEREFYSSSNAKSGGQKEKLAYTILAAALAYQFNHQTPGKSGETLRFIMIDEAFGSGSPDLVSYAMSLFESLRLQVMVVTPLNKINEIEPYVSRVALARGKSGEGSSVQNMSVQHYLETYQHIEQQKEHKLTGSAASLGLKSTSTVTTVKPQTETAAAAEAAPDPEPLERTEPVEIDLFAHLDNNEQSAASDETAAADKPADPEEDSARSDSERAAELAQAREYIAARQAKLHAAAPGSSSAAARLIDAFTSERELQTDAPKMAVLPEGAAGAQLPSAHEILEQVEQEKPPAASKEVQDDAQTEKIKAAKLAEFDELKRRFGLS